MVRRADTFARYGGEEFLLIMPEADECVALAAIERIRQRIAASAEATLGHALYILRRIDPYDGAGRRAELAAPCGCRALCAKDAGRNRSRVADQPAA